MSNFLTTTGSKRVILQTGKTICAQIHRELSKQIEFPPEPTTCCMSGCSNCVWIEYAETLVKLMDGNCDEARQIILKKIEDPNLKMFLAIELKSLQYQKNHNDHKTTKSKEDILK